MWFVFNILIWLCCIKEIFSNTTSFSTDISYLSPVFDRFRTIKISFKSRIIINNILTFELSTPYNNYLSTCQVFLSSNLPEKKYWQYLVPNDKLYSLREGYENHSPIGFDHSPDHNLYTFRSVPFTYDEQDLYLHGCRMQNEEFLMSITVRRDGRLVYEKHNMIIPSVATPVKDSIQAMHHIVLLNGNTFAKFTIDPDAAESIPFVFRGDVCIIEVEGIFSANSLGTVETLTSIDMEVFLTYPKLVIHFLKMTRIDQLIFPPQLHQFRYRVVAQSSRSTRWLHAPHSLTPDDNPYVFDSITLVSQQTNPSIDDSDILSLKIISNPSPSGDTLIQFAFTPSPSLSLFHIFQSTLNLIHLRIPSELIRGTQKDFGMYIQSSTLFPFFGHSSSGSHGIDPLDYNYTELYFHLNSNDRNSIFYPNSGSMMDGELVFIFNYEYNGACEPLDDLPLQIARHKSIISKPNGSNPYDLEYDRIMVVNENCSTLPDPIVSWEIDRISSTRRIIEVQSYTPDSVSNEIFFITYRMEVIWKVRGKFENLSPLTHSGSAENTLVIENASDLTSMDSFFSFPKEKFLSCKICFTVFNFLCLPHVPTVKRDNLDNIVTVVDNTITIYLPSYIEYFTYPLSKDFLSVDGLAITCEIFNVREDIDVDILTPPLLPQKIDLSNVLIHADHEYYQPKNDVRYLRHATLSKGGFSVKIAPVIDYEQLTESQLTPEMRQRIKKTEQHVMFTIHHDDLWNDSEVVAVRDQMQKASRLEVEYYYIGSEQEIQLSTPAYLHHGSSSFYYSPVDIDCKIVDRLNLFPVYLKLSVRKPNHRSVIFSFQKLTEDENSYFPFPMTLSDEGNESMTLQIQCGHSIRSDAPDWNLFTQHSPFVSIIRNRSDVPVSLSFQRGNHINVHHISAPDSQKVIFVGQGYGSLRSQGIVPEFTKIHQIRTSEQGIHQPLQLTLDGIFHNFGHTDFVITSEFPCQFGGQELSTFSIQIPGVMYFPVGLIDKYFLTNVPIEVGGVHVLNDLENNPNNGSVSKAPAYISFPDEIPTLTFQLSGRIVMALRQGMLPKELSQFQFRALLRWYPDLSILRFPITTSTVFNHQTLQVDTIMPQDLPFIIESAYLPIKPMALTYTPTHSREVEMAFLSIRSPEPYVPTANARATDLQSFSFEDQVAQWTLKPTFSTKLVTSGTALITHDGCSQCLRIDFAGDTVTEDEKTNLVIGNYTVEFTIRLAQFQRKSFHRLTQFIVFVYVREYAATQELFSASDNPPPSSICNNDDLPITHTTFSLTKPLLFGIQFRRNSHLYLRNINMKLNLERSGVLLHPNSICIAIPAFQKATPKLIEAFFSDTEKHVGLVSSSQDSVEYVLLEEDLSIADNGLIIICDKASLIIDRLRFQRIDYIIDSVVYDVYLSRFQMTGFPQDSSQAVLHQTAPFGNYLYTPMTFEIDYPSVLSMVHLSELSTITIDAPDLICFSRKVPLCSIDIEIIRGDMSFSLNIPVPSTFLKTSGIRVLSTPLFSSLHDIFSNDSLKIKLTNWMFQKHPHQWIDSITPIKRVTFSFATHPTLETTFQQEVLSLGRLLAPPNQYGASIELALPTETTIYPIQGTLAKMIYSIPITATDYYTQPYQVFLVMSVPVGLAILFTNPTTKSTMVSCEVFAGSKIWTKFDLISKPYDESSSKLYVGLNFEFPTSQLIPLKAELKCQVPGYFTALYTRSPPNSKLQSISLSHVHELTKVEEPFMTYSSGLPSSSSALSTNFNLPRVTIPTSKVQLNFEPKLINQFIQMKIDIEYMPTYLLPGDAFLVMVPEPYGNGDISFHQPCTISIGERKTLDSIHPLTIWSSNPYIKILHNGSRFIELVVESLLSPESALPNASFAKGTFLNHPLSGIKIVCDGVQIHSPLPSAISGGMQLVAQSQHITMPVDWILPSHYRVPNSIIWSSSAHIAIEGIYPDSFAQYSVEFSNLVIDAVEKDLTPSEALELGSMTITLSHFTANSNSSITVDNLHFQILLPKGFRTRHYSTSFSSSTMCSWEKEGLTAPTHVYVKSENPNESFSSHNVRIDIGMFVLTSTTTFSIICQGFGVPVFAPPNVLIPISIHSGGGTVERDTLSIIGPVITSGIATFKQKYTVLSGSKVASYQYTPSFQNTMTRMKVTLSPFGLIGTSFDVSFNLIQDTEIITAFPVECSVIIRSPNTVNDLFLPGIVQFSSATTHRITVSFMTPELHPMEPNDTLTVDCSSFISPNAIIHPSNVDLDFSATTRGFEAIQPKFRFLGTTSQTNTFDLKRILINPGEGTFSVYISELLGGIPSLGGKIVFSLPELMEFVSVSLVQCFFHKHDGFSFENRADDDDNSLISALRVSVGSFNVKTFDEIELIVGEDHTTQTTRHRVSVYFDESLHTRILKSPFGYVIQCRGATPKEVELLSVDSYYIQIFERLANEGENVNAKKIYSSLVSTSSATLVSTRAPGLAKNTFFVQSSFDSGGMGDIEIELNAVSVDLVSKDVLEVVFPPSHHYQFNIPFQGKKIPSSKTSNVDEFNTSSCDVFSIEIDEIGERLIGEAMESSAFVASISSVSLYQSTVTAASIASQTLGRIQPTILSVRFSPQSDGTTPVVVFPKKSSLLIRCYNVRYPNVGDIIGKYEDDKLSVSLYRSLEETIQLNRTETTIDTLLVRRAFNDHIFMPLFGPQRLQKVRFYSSSLRYGEQTMISIEIERAQSIQLQKKNLGTIITIDIPGAWQLTRKTQCVLSIGSPYYEDATINGQVVVKLSEAVPSTPQYIDVLSFAFTSSTPTLNQDKKLHLFCNPVLMPNVNIFEISGENTLTTHETPSVSFIASQHNHDILAESIESTCQIVSAIGPKNVRVLAITQQFLSHQTFNQLTVESWRDRMEEVTQLRGDKTRISSPSTSSPSTSTSLNNFAIQSIHQEIVNVAGKSKQYYRVTMESHLHAPHPWSDIELIAERLMSPSASEAMNRYFSTYYDAGQYYQQFQWKSTPSVCFNNQIDPDLDESDVDCGGNQCLPCQIGQTCHLDSDCWTGNCNSGVCLDVSSAALGPVVLFSFVYSILIILFLIVFI